MKILASVYAVNPYKGSEDGTGWNLVLQIARLNQVIAITRKNNQEAIEQYIKENPNKYYQNIQWEYYDLPKWARFWKRGSKGAMPYYLLWQLFLPLFVSSRKLKFDIAHALNFHNDWTFSLLWLFGKPFVWGPVGHHPDIPKEFLKLYSKKEQRSLKGKTLLKRFFWNFEPLLKMTKINAKHIFAVNSSVEKVLKVPSEKITVLPAVATKMEKLADRKDSDIFTVLSIGRFVALKGFDLAIESFAAFYEQLSKEEKEKVRFCIVGKGPAKERLVNIVESKNLVNTIQFIEWMDRSKLMDLYQTSDCFLFPSHEGAGMVVPEALSFGLPVICLDNCGPGELVDTSCAFKSPYDSYNRTVAKLSEGLKLLFKNPVLKSQMSKAAIEKHRNHFDWDFKGDHFYDVYQGLYREIETSTTSQALLNVQLENQRKS